MYRGTISYQQTFQQKICKPEGSGMIYFQWWKEKMSHNQEYSTGQAVFEGES